MVRLTNNDYRNILEFYNKPIPESKINIRTNAEKLLVSKLCRCIKKLEPMNEARSIGICTKTIINNKGFIRGKFTCKKKQTIQLSKKRNENAIGSNKNNKSMKRSKSRKRNGNKKSKKSRRRNKK